MRAYDIKLAEDTISETELSDLAAWIVSGARLTKGSLTKKFEQQFAHYLGTKYAVYVNSGSSANLLMLSSLVEGGYLDRKVAIVPAVSWITTLSPFLQLGFETHLCDSEMDTLGMDPEHFEALCKKHRPSVAILVHVLGHSNKMEQLLEICERYNVILLEDSCEALGTTHQNSKLGSLGKAGSFSFYYGHHLSTIEGGMVTTNDNKLYNYMLSIRSHGWARDVEDAYKTEWSDAFNVDECRDLYTFYNTGFNLRSTDLNAFLGISQLKKVDAIVQAREQNFKQYAHKLGEKFYVQQSKCGTLSSFAYGTFVENRQEVYRHLLSKNIESRPLICGSLGRQPFWIKRFGATHLPVADQVHDYGIYLPNHLQLNSDKIDYITDCFSEVAIPKSVNQQLIKTS